MRGKGDTMSYGRAGPKREAPDLTVKLLTAVANTRDEEVESLLPLASKFHPDAWERSVESTTVSTTIMLDVSDCSVEIDAEGTVTAFPNDTDR